MTSSIVATKLNYLQKFLHGKMINPEMAAAAIIKNTITVNAFVIAINDLFMAIGLFFFASVILLPFISNIKMGSEETHGH